jgi:hypothetical protein
MSTPSPDARHSRHPHAVRRDSRTLEIIEDALDHTFNVAKGIKRRLSSPVRQGKFLRRLTREGRRSSSKELSGDESGSAECVVMLCFRVRVDMLTSAPEKDERYHAPRRPNSSHSKACAIMFENLGGKASPTLGRRILTTMSTMSQGKWM